MKASKHPEVLDWNDLLCIDEGRQPNNLTIGQFSEGLLKDFIDWYAINYGYRITKENVKLFLTEKWNSQA
jgi:hypothetical protein